MPNGHAAVRAFASLLLRLAVLVNGAPSATVDGWEKSLMNYLIPTYLLQWIH